MRYLFSTIAVVFMLLLSEVAFAKLCCSYYCCLYDEGKCATLCRECTQCSETPNPEGDVGGGGGKPSVGGDACPPSGPLVIDMMELDKLGVPFKVRGLVDPRVIRFKNGTTVDLEKEKIFDPSGREINALNAPGSMPGDEVVPKVKQKSIIPKSFPKLR